MLTTLTLLLAGGVSVVLPSSATSNGLEISVAEIATVTGEDAALVARVEAASLGYAPAPGYHRTLRADLVLASLRQTLPGVDIRIEGAPRCKVSPEVVRVPGTRIQAEAGAALRDALGGLDASAAPEGLVADVELPKGDVEPRLVVKLERGPVQPGLRSVPVEVWFGEHLYRTVTANFRVSLWRRQAVLDRAVSAGQPLDRSMFTVQRVPVTEVAQSHALGLDEVEGSIALNAMHLGATVTERDVHREVIVRRGDTVTVRITKGLVVVTDVAIAKRDGRMGERVAVTLRSTGVELIAAVRGRQSVEVTIQ